MLSMYHHHANYLGAIDDFYFTALVQNAWVLYQVFNGNNRAKWGTFCITLADSLMKDTV